jgi:hypothetical protein
LRKKDKSLAEQDELLAVEKKKAAFNAAQLMESEKAVAQLKGQLLELQSALELK